MNPRKKSLRAMVKGIGLLAAAAFALLVIDVAVGRGAEIVPSVGISKPVSGGGDARLFSSVAFRDQLAPVVMGEIGVAYRSESRFSDQLRVRSWPVTASLYLTPVPAVYAGAGAGWYQTTYDYPAGTQLADETRQDFGVHVGGGLRMPLGPAAAVDLGGRYVMLRDQQSHLVPQKFNPDFWTTTLGLAVHF